MTEVLSAEDGEPCLIYTVKQAMRVLSLGRTELYEEIRSKRLESFKRGRRRLFSRNALQAYANRIEQEGKEV
ncbi:helix-turn-helix domain-containing protein [Flindersiella endophytica]